MMKNQQTFKELNVMVDEMELSDYNQVAQAIDDAVTNGLLIDSSDYKLLKKRLEAFKPKPKRGKSPDKQSMEQREGLGDW